MINIARGFIIIEDEKNKKENLQLLSEIVKLMGFKKVSFLTVHEHDEIIAFTSQLTHAIAVSLVNSDSEKYETNRFIGDSALRSPAERANAMLKHLKALQRVTLDPRAITTITATALVIINLNKDTW